MAHILSPLAGYDTPTYAMAYWCAVTVVGIGTLSMALWLIGLRTLRRVAKAVTAALSWPAAVTNTQFVIIVATVLMIMATVPHYTWATRSGSSGGTAPFSAIEANAIAFIWKPAIERMSPSVMS